MEAKKCKICDGSIDQSSEVYLHLGCACSGINRPARKCNSCGTWYWSEDSSLVEKSDLDRNSNRI